MLQNLFFRLRITANRLLASNGARHLSACNLPAFSSRHDSVLRQLERPPRRYLQTSCVVMCSGESKKNKKIPNTSKIFVRTPEESGGHTTMTYGQAKKMAAKQHKNLVEDASVDDIVPTFRLEPMDKKEKVDESELIDVKEKELRSKMYVIGSRIDMADLNVKLEKIVEYLEKGQMVNITIKKATTDNSSSFEDHARSVLRAIDSATRSIAKPVHMQGKDMSLQYRYQPIKSKARAKKERVRVMTMKELKGQTTEKE